MKLGVPTLCRYDLLDRLLASAARGTVKPTGYIIIDNGGGYTKERAAKLVDGAPVEFVSPGRNIGVAASWNLILDMAQAPVVISNDDVELLPDQFGELEATLGYAMFAEGEGWCLFGQRPELVKTIGYYDENFWPAYYEDVDYDVRMRLAGIPRVRALREPVQHVGWATTRSLQDADWLATGRAKNQAYMIRKWGSDTSLLAQYTQPFNGLPPPDWNERTVVESRIVMRWDVLNHIAELINADRYLEIGVSDGTCMRQVKVKERWGVDPNPHPAGVIAADYFCGRTSDEFFQKRTAGRDESFDLVFIDGNHTAAQSYIDVMNASYWLTSHGVIVLHDCNPHTEAMQIVPAIQSEWTGDVWKTIARLRSMGVCARVINADYGIGIVLPRHTIEPVKLSQPAYALTYADLVSRREELLGLMEPWEWKEWFHKTWDPPGLIYPGTGLQAHDDA